MADEFVKGLGILTTAGLIWMAISAWLTTAGFEGTQLIAPPPEDLGTYGELTIFVREIVMWFAIFGALAFWVVIPVGREVRAYFEERRSGTE
ncbi:MAG: hypothetical protein PPP58_03220 [Natronomonas sp.]